MKNAIITVLIVFAALFDRQAKAQIYDTNNVQVQTFAGYGIPAYVDGQGQFSAFSSPAQIVSDTASNLFVWDSNNDRVRKITPDGTVSTFAGGGNYFEGYGTNVSLSWSPVSAMAIDHSNALWLVMSSGNYGGSTYLLKIAASGYVSIENGGLTNLTSSSGICFDSANTLFYSGGNRIYNYNPTAKIVQPFAGNGVAANFDGQGTVFCAFSSPTVLACDQADNIYVWDSGNGTIRRVDHSQNVTTIAGNGYSYSPADGVGTNASFYGVAGLFTDNTGNVYLACGSSIRRMDAQTNVTTLAGVFYGYGYGNVYANGPGDVARFNNASGGCFSHGTIFVADAGNNRIRSISFGTPAPVASPASLQLATYPGVQITGVVGRTYQVQSSPNMTNWTTVATVLLNSTPFLWIDQNPVSGNKFYRAVMLP